MSQGVRKRRFNLAPLISRAGQISGVKKMNINSIQTIAILIAFACAPIQFAQGQSRTADIIIAVDNSASMVDEANEVQLNLNSFASQLLSGGLDIRLVLISADSTHASGICVSAPLGSGSCPIDENKPAYTHIRQEVGSSDALNFIINTYAQWAPEMRPEAIKHVIVVSDDNSTLTATEFNSAFLALDASHVGYQFHSIAGTETLDSLQCVLSPGNVCCQGEVPLCTARGQNYIDLSASTGGVFNNLCLQDFNPFFDEMASAVIQSVPAAIKINEILPDPIGPDAGNEWIELYNDDNYAFNIGGWSIETARSEWSTVFTLPDATVINPGAFLVIGGSLVDFADYNLLPDALLDLGNATTSGDAVRIVSTDGSIMDTVVYGDNNTDSFLDDSGNIASSLAPIGISGESIARNYDGLDTDASGDDFSVSSPTPGLSNSLTCDVVTVSYITEYDSASYEACDVLILGPGFIAEELSNVTANSGWEIDIMPGFLVEHSATFSANVCGQSLCQTSPDPMPYGCHSCVNQICDSYPNCCGIGPPVMPEGFNADCLDRVDTVCGLVCE